MTSNGHKEQSVHAAEIMTLLCERLDAGQKVPNLTFAGISMLPMLRQGKDSVELAPLPERLKKYDLPLYRGENGNYVMHRVVEVREDCYICLGDNTYHYERVAPERMAAVVCAFNRAGKRISVENRWYQMYCRVWCAVFPVRRFIKRMEWRLKGAEKRLIGSFGRE